MSSHVYLIGPKAFKKELVLKFFVTNGKCQLLTRTN